jgi:hypothetical protein
MAAFEENVSIIFLEKSYAGKLKSVANMPIYTNELCLIYRYENKNIRAIRTVVAALKSFIASSSFNNTRATSNANGVLHPSVIQND